MTRHCQLEECNKPLVRKSYKNADGYTRQEDISKFKGRKYCNASCAAKAKRRNRAVAIIIDQTLFERFCFAQPIGGFHE